MREEEDQWEEREEVEEVVEESEEESEEEESEEESEEMEEDDDEDEEEEEDDEDDEEEEEDEDDEEEELKPKKFKPKKKKNFFSDTILPVSDVSSSSSARPSSSSSQIFVPYRALGMVSGDVPIAIVHQQKQTLLFVAMGKVVQVFDAKKLTLLFVINCEKKVKALASLAGMVFCACKNDIYVYHRNTQIATLSHHSSPISHLLAQGDDLLFSIDEKGGFGSWSVDSKKGIKQRGGFRVDGCGGGGEGGEGEGMRVTAVAHPVTYLNKLLLGGGDGRMLLVNIAKNKLVFSFKGWGAEVTALKQSPALDVMGVGLADGRIFLHNLKTDKSLMCFQHLNASVTNIAFRTDGPPIMTSSNPIGEVAVWNLKSRKLENIMRDVHPGYPVVSMEFFPEEPIMVTSSSSNALKMFIFDQPDNSGRLLRERSGHSAPPTKVRFYGEDHSRSLLTAGSDQALRFFNTLWDGGNRELSQGRIRSEAKKRGKGEDELKLPLIIDFDARPVREKEWDNIITVHTRGRAGLGRKGGHEAYTWSFERKAKGKRVLTKGKVAKGKGARVQEKSSGGYVAGGWTSCAVSVCGNFAFLGAETGEIEMFNIQSGLHRGSLRDIPGGLEYAGHNNRVTGVVVEVMGKYLVSSSLDGTVKIWDLPKKKIHSTVEIGAGVQLMEANQDGSVIVCACDDLMLMVVDIEVGRVIRRFSGHKNKITDVAFSDDGRWVVSSSTDNTICVWDLPSARLIDRFKVNKAVTSLAFSPTGNYLATTHVDDLGVYLWANRAYYGRVLFRPVGEDDELVAVGMPGVVRAEEEGEEEEEEGELSESEEEEEEEEGKKKRKKVREEEEEEEEEEGKRLLEISGLSNNRWKNLPNLDIIRKRNKPKEAPKKPERAPFFLDLMMTKGAGANGDVKEEIMEGNEFGETKNLAIRDSLPRSNFYLLLRKREEEEEEEGERRKKGGYYREVIEYMSELGPSAVERELSMIQTHDDEDLRLALIFFLDSLDSRLEFDLTQAWLNLFLKLHGDLLPTRSSLEGYCEELQKREEVEWTRVEGMFHSTLCLINLMTGMTYNG